MEDNTKYQTYVAYDVQEDLDAEPVTYCVVLTDAGVDEDEAIEFWAMSWLELFEDDIVFLVEEVPKPSEPAYRMGVGEPS